MKKSIFIALLFSIFMCLGSCGQDPEPKDPDRTVEDFFDSLRTGLPETATEPPVTKAVRTKKTVPAETEAAEEENALRTEPVIVVQPLANKASPAETPAPTAAPRTEAPAPSAAEAPSATEAPSVTEAPVATVAAPEEATVTVIVTSPAGTAVPETKAAKKTTAKTTTAKTTTAKTTTAKTTTIKTTTAKTTTIKTTTAKTTTVKTTTTAKPVTTAPPVTTEPEEEEEACFDDYIGLIADGWYDAEVLDVIPEFPENITGWGIILVKTDNSAPFCLNQDPELCRKAVPGAVNSFLIDNGCVFTTMSGLYRREDGIGCRAMTVSDDFMFSDVRLSDKSSPGAGDDDITYTVDWCETEIPDDIEDLYYDVSIEGRFTAMVIKKYDGSTGVGCGAIMALFQDVPFYISLTPEICSQIEENEVYTFHIPKQQIRTGLTNLFMYEAGDINAFAIIENQALIDSVREPKAIEIGEECWHVKYTRP